MSLLDPVNGQIRTLTCNGFNRASEAFMEAGSFLMHAPHENAELLALLTTEPGQDRPVNCYVFYQGSAVAGVAASPPQTDMMWLSSMKPAALSEITEVIASHLQSRNVPAAGLIEHGSGMEQNIRQMWNFANDREAQSNRTQTYHLYNGKDKLPPSRFSNALRRAAQQDTGLMVGTLLGKEILDRLSPAVRQRHGLQMIANRTHIMQGTPDNVTDLALYTLRPIGDEGLLVRMAGMTAKPPRSEPHVPLEILTQEITEQFAALAQHAKAQGRWALFSMPTDHDLPTTEAATRLGFSNAGGLSRTRLIVKQTPATSGAPANQLVS